ncbi:hypothetical protein ACFLZH_02410 [Patescibacteria group bacterium]
MPKCKNCSIDFSITEKDKDFYKKIDVPEPTWCPHCREMRRMAWCNEWALYQDKCGLCNKSVIGQFPASDPRTQYCVECWWGDNWNPVDYGRDIDWDRSFFEQLHELEIDTPHCCVSTDIKNINSEYTHHAGQEKNCYMIFHATFAEDCYYGYGIKKAKDCTDVHYCHESELCYECTDVKGCHSLAWSQDCFDCSSSYFLRDCIGCMDCVLCTGLRNKKYCFKNEQLSKEEYEKKLAEIDLSSFKELQKYLKEFKELQKKHTYRYLAENMNENSLGDHLYKAKNCEFCFDSSDIEDSKYCTQMQLGVKDCYDIYQFGVNVELGYECAMTGTNSYNVHFCYLCLWQVSDLLYSIETYSSKDCFGCVGLKKNKYCILNKQYSEEQYFELKKKLIEKMKRDEEFGEFLPIKYSLTPYNVSTAQNWYPKTKEEVLEKGWPWQDDLPGTFGKETFTEIPDNIKDVPENIINEVLACEDCGKNYKIIPQELEYYKRHRYPLPQKCFECRRKTRMNLRNPRNFWQRNCDKCNKEIFSTYSPDREETVYCKKCYLEKIY